MSTASPASPPQQYVVIARRYRPQSFHDLVGQSHIAQALGNAIDTNRVGHAYLFTGARGTGKTSTARILAKCLNCSQGPTPTPCNQCDACVCVSTGDDVDVIEIDGASNRGIDEIRQLRSNVSVRPSRSRFKIYIIDEVHMLTAPAFNALLKTLEEPPEHVKFIFCTTDPEKIPITVLSRCQRFDFAPVETGSIVARLKQIVATEGMQADDDALQLLARRANGSMRDSQSLLEQLLAFGDHTITLDDVHRMLGTAHSGEIAALVSSIVARDTAAALMQVDRLIGGGGDPGQIAEQLLGWVRDMMAAAVGCDAGLMLHSGPADFATLGETGKTLGLETMLAVAQILDETLTRMRQSMHVRTLLEIAIVRVCKLDDLDNLSNLIAQVKPGAAAPPAARVAPAAAQTSPRAAAVRNAPSQAASPDAPQKKSDAVSEPATTPTTTPASTPAAAARKSIDLVEENVAQVWRQAVESIEDTTREFASCCDSVAIAAPNQLVVRFKAEYTLHKERCERPDLRQRLETAVAELTGRKIRIDFQVLPPEKSQSQVRQPVMTKRQRMRELEKHPFVREAIETFDGEVTDLNSPHRSS